MRRGRELLSLFRAPREGGVGEGGERLRPPGLRGKDPAFGFQLAGEGGDLRIVGEGDERNAAGERAHDGVQAHGDEQIETGDRLHGAPGRTWLRKHDLAGAEGRAQPPGQRQVVLQIALDRLEREERDRRPALCDEAGEHSHERRLGGRRIDPYVPRANGDPDMRRA